MSLLQKKSIKFITLLIFVLSSYLNQIQAQASAKILKSPFQLYCYNKSFAATLVNLNLTPEGVPLDAPSGSRKAIVVIDQETGLKLEIEAVAAAPGNGVGDIHSEYAAAVYMNLYRGDELLDSAYSDKDKINQKPKATSLAKLNLADSILTTAQMNLTEKNLSIKCQINLVEIGK